MISMKAIAYDRFGGIDELHETVLPRPTLAKGQVLVQMRASTINVIDSRSRKGLMSPMVNKKFPKIPGVDVAGIVAEVAPNVTGFKVGDEVFGSADAFKGGAFAEFVAVSAKSLAPKPTALSFAEAAAISIAGTAALVAMRDLGKVSNSSKVLIHGGSGAVGLAAIAIAKKLGAHVTAVAGAQGIAAIKAAGADVAIDYRKQDGGKFATLFDVILNASGSMPYAKAVSHLTSNGRLIEASPFIAVIVGSALANPFRGKKHLPLLSTPSRAILDQLAAWAGDGSVKPMIAQTFPLTEVKQAFAAMEAGGVVGKVAISF
jgi:NADPH:quinone reductase-like Zn-dependent oxidoreductase